MGRKERRTEIISKALNTEAKHLYLKTVKREIRTLWVPVKIVPISGCE